VQGGFRLSANVSGQGEVTIAIGLTHRNVVYPIGSFAEIREFKGMLQQLKESGTWSGIHFRGYTVQHSTETTDEIVFYRYGDGVVLGFSIEEWDCLRALIVSALATPQLRPFLEELELEYGEL
jgi:hypothetical protein